MAGTSRDERVRVVGSARVADVHGADEGVQLDVRVPVFGARYERPLRVRPALQAGRVVELAALGQRALLPDHRAVLGLHLFAADRAERIGVARAVQTPEFCKNVFPYNFRLSEGFLLSIGSVNSNYVAYKNGNLGGYGGTIFQQSPPPQMLRKVEKVSYIFFPTSGSRKTHLGKKIKQP